MRYTLEDKPGLGPFLLYGLQWWAVSLPTVLIIGTVVARLHFSALEPQIWYLQKLFILTGVTLTAQVLFGHRLPAIEGPASVLLIGMLAAVSSGDAAIYTAILIGGALMAVIAAAGLLARIRPLFTPRIVAVILILIALTLLPNIIHMSLPDTAAPAFNLLFVLSLTLAMLACNRLLPGAWKSLAVLIGLGGGTLIHRLWNGAPPAAVFAATEHNRSLFLERFDFQPGVIVSFLVCFLALSVNQLGSLESIGQLVGAGDMDGRMRRGQLLCGILNAAAGVMGVIGPVSYSLSAGIVSATGCAARLTLVPAGIGLAVCGFFPGVVLFFSRIPETVMGAMLLYLMAAQLASGLMLLVTEKCIDAYSGAVTVALPLMVGLLIAFLPESACASFPDIVRPIVCNGFIVGAILVVFLEHVIFSAKAGRKAG